MNNNNHRLPPVERESLSEAASRPLDFDPNIRANFIRQMLHDIPIWMSQGETEQQIFQRVPEFAERYPELFKKIIEKQDLAPVQSMLAMLDKMGQGTLSQHQASVIIGKKLVDRYVTPQLNGGGSRR
jgi:hypothetical protein